MEQRRLNNILNLSVDLELNNLNNGMYFVVVQGPTIYLSKRFVVTK